MIASCTRCQLGSAFMPLPLSRIYIEHLGGAMGRVPSDETAFVHRSAPFDLIVIAVPVIFADPTTETALSLVRRLLALTPS